MTNALALVARLEKWATELDAYQDTYEQEANMLREAIAALAAAPQETPQAELLAAFRSGFAWCMDGTDKYGEYNGGSVEDGFAGFTAATRETP